MIKRLFYGPPDWLRTAVSARLRAAIAFWLLVLDIPLLGSAVWIWPTAIWLASAMLVFNTALSLYALVAAETPVEVEEE